jgi:hypothetical protein
MRIGFFFITLAILAVVRIYGKYFPKIVPPVLIRYHPQQSLFRNLKTTYLDPLISHTQAEV